MSNSPLHKFHIPVMGLGFTIDTPIKVAHYGIDSVVSIVDDDLIEKMRKVHSKKRNIPFDSISAKEEDFRAKRITEYLNMMKTIVEQNFENLKKSIGVRNGEFEKYISFLSDDAIVKNLYHTAIQKNYDLDEIREMISEHLYLGSIDVNIMTKVDKANFSHGKKLPFEFNDAHASLRGFANSNLNSSIVLSAGMNPRLYSYFENFADFFPDSNGNLKKKIILKVSDFRSALIQGKFLAKKGLWVSEYRIESGLNCGGHAFATDGFLMGPILEEFKIKREELIKTTHDILAVALKKKNKPFIDKPLDLKITAQGGVGTFEEQNFLLDYYQVDSVGWGTPFLLVPEATNVDELTLNKLCEAKEKDLYLSNISPLGVPFNSLRGNTKDIEKLEKAASGKPGSPCPKKYLISNTEFTESTICTASRQYQSKKLDEQNNILSEEEYSTQYEKIIDKSCLCVGLAASALQINNTADKIDGKGVLICPGPNLAYYSSIISLKQMVDHINGRLNIISRTDRPNMFIKELSLYLQYLENKVDEVEYPPTQNQIKYFDAFQTNLSLGIEYYEKLFSTTQEKIIDINFNPLKDLAKLEEEFDELRQKMIVKDLITTEMDVRLEITVA
jgi:hypothetical protein